MLLDFYHLSRSNRSVVLIECEADNITGTKSRGTKCVVRMRTAGPGTGSAPKREKREGPIEMWRESFPLVRTWIGCVDCHPHRRERERESSARKLSSLNFALVSPSFLVVRGPTVEQPGSHLLRLRDDWGFGRERRTSQLAPITTFNAVDYIVYIRPKRKGGGGELGLVYNGNAATDVSGPLSSVDCTRPTTSITTMLPIRSKSNQTSGDDALLDAVPKDPAPI